MDGIEHTPPSAALHERNKPSTRSSTTISTSSRDAIGRVTCRLPAARPARRQIYFHRRGDQRPLSKRLDPALNPAPGRHGDGTVLVPHADRRTTASCPSTLYLGNVSHDTESRHARPAEETSSRGMTNGYFAGDDRTRWLLHALTYSQHDARPVPSYPRRRPRSNE